MTRAWKVEILDTMPDMVLARFYYNSGVAIRFKAKAGGTTYSATIASIAGRFFYRVSNGRKQVLNIIKLVPEQSLQLTLILMAVSDLCDYYNLIKFIDGSQFCYLKPLDVYVICPSQPWAPCQ